MGKESRICAYVECDNLIERGGGVRVYLNEREYIFCSSGCRDLAAATLGVNLNPVRPDIKSKEFRVYERERRI